MYPTWVGSLAFFLGFEVLTMLFHFNLGFRSETCSSSDVHWIWIMQEQMLDSVFLS